MADLFWHRLALWILGLGLITGLGCSSTAPSNFYTLSPISKAVEVSSDKGGAGQPLSIGIGPVRLPQYLVRQEIVTRTDANKIELAEFDLWGGSLQDDFSRNLIENLSRLLAVQRVNVYLLPGIGSLDYRVAVDVIRFDGKLGGDISLIASWTIREGQGKKIIRVETSRIQESTGGPSYEAMVEGMSRALGQMSRQIADAIKSLPR